MRHAPLPSNNPSAPARAARVIVGGCAPAPFFRALPEPGFLRLPLPAASGVALRTGASCSVARSARSSAVSAAQTRGDARGQKPDAYRRGACVSDGAAARGRGRARAHQGVPLGTCARALRPCGRAPPRGRATGTDGHQAP